MGVLGELSRHLGGLVPAPGADRRLRAALSRRHGDAGHPAADLQPGCRSRAPVVGARQRCAARRRHQTDRYLLLEPAALGTLGAARATDLHLRAVAAAGGLRWHCRTARRLVVAARRTAGVGAAGALAARRGSGALASRCHGAAVRHADRVAAVARGQPDGLRHADLAGAAPAAFAHGDTARLTPVASTGLAGRWPGAGDHAGGGAADQPVRHRPGAGLAFDPAGAAAGDGRRASGRRYRDSTDWRNRAAVAAWLRRVRTRAGAGQPDERQHRRRRGRAVHRPAQ